MKMIFRYLVWVAALGWMFMSFSAEVPKASTVETVMFQSGPAQPALLELFSSEGCSSCPPADEWLSGLKKSQGLWAEIVPVCFHVDYWDPLGWKDNLGSKDYTQRQRNYAKYWRLKSVYTPNFVVNGREWKDGFPNFGMLPASSSNSAGSLKIKAIGRGNFEVSFTVPHSAAGQWRAQTAILGFGIPSDVTAGENAGRKMNHDFAVLAFQEKELEKINGIFQTSFHLEKKEPVPAARYAVAVWVVQDNDFIPVQAAGGYLPAGYE